MHQTSDATAKSDSDGAAEYEKLEEKDEWVVKSLRRENFSTLQHLNGIYFLTKRHCQNFPK